MATGVNKSQASPATGTMPGGNARPTTYRRLKLWQWLVLLLVGGLLVMVGVQMRRNGPLAAGPVGAGERAPNFTLTTFEGDTVRLADLRGQVVVVNFWASWCKPCEEEAADLENTWRAYRDQGVMFIGVDYVDTETEARAYLDRFNITYPNGRDLGTKISTAYRIRGVPETFVIDQSGTLRALFVGPVDAVRLQQTLEPLLAGAEG